MMHKNFLRIAIAAIFIACAGSAMAQRLAYSGLDPSAHQGNPGAVPYARNLAQWAGGSADPSIAYVDTSGVASLLASAGFTDLTEIPIEDLDTADLSGFDLLWVGRILNSGDAADAALAEVNVLAYFNGGGNIVTEDQRVEPDSYNWLPFGDNLDPETIDANPVTIVEPGHPTMDGLTDGDLSGWGNSFHKVFNTPGVDGFLTVATNDSGVAVLIVRGGAEPATPVPALNLAGLLALIFLMGTIGFVLFRKKHAL